jgi:hypothetical protein
LQHFRVLSGHRILHHFRVLSCYRILHHFRILSGYLISGCPLSFETGVQ